LILPLVEASAGGNVESLLTRSRGEAPCPIEF
jgi:hypothetical protein